MGRIHKKSLKIPKGQSESVYRRTTQWPKDKVHKDKQRSTKHIYKTKDRVTQTPLIGGGGWRRKTMQWGRYLKYKMDKILGLQRDLIN